MTYIALGYTLGALTVGMGLYAGHPVVILFGVCLLFVTVWEAGKS